MKHLITLLSLTLLGCISAMAQENQQGGTVTVKQSSSIDDVVNGNKKQSGNTSGSQQPGGSTRIGEPDFSPELPTHPDKVVEHAIDEKEHKNNSQASQRSGGQRGEGDGKVMKRVARLTSSSKMRDGSQKKILVGARKEEGWRVQVWAGGNTRKDREEAEKVGKKVKEKFPDKPVYVHFYSPRWICRIGNFQDQKEALRYLREIRGMGYKSANLVKMKISLM